MKFLVDMPITSRAVAVLESAGHQADHASAVGLSTARDSEILGRARAEGRIIVTADLDFPRLLAIQGTDSPGILLFRGGDLSDDEMLELLRRVLALADERLDLDHAIVVVDRERLRVHRLPIERPERERT